MVGMYGSEAKFTQGARVRLRATVDPAIYGDFACYGNEGVISDVREDRFGLPEVYINWDKNHWTYNGVGDCWTFEDHFELVEDKMSEKQDQVQQLLAMFAQGLNSILGGEETPQAKEETPAAKLRNRLLEAAEPFQQEDRGEAFAHAVEAASARLSGAEAFIIIGIEYSDHPGAPQGVLAPFAEGFSKNPESEILATAHMSKVAANAHQHLALEMVTNLTNES